MKRHEMARDIRFALGLLRKRPFDVLFQITNRCNMKCSFCDFWPNGVPYRDELSTADYHRVARELAQIGCCLISIEGGEPFVRPDLIDIVRGFAEAGHLPVLYTNGWFVTDEQAHALFAAGMVQVGVSVDYADAARHDAKRGLPDTTRRAWLAVDSFRKAAPHGGRQVHVMTVLTRDNQYELEPLLHQSAAHDVGHYVTLLSTNGYRRGKGVDELPDEGISEKLLDLYRRFPHFRNPSVYLAGIRSFQQQTNLPTCRAGIQSFNVDHTGNVSACIERIDQPVGNVRDEPLPILWNKLNAPPERAEVSGCQKCWTLCRGVGQALGNGGTLRGWYELGTRMRSSY